MTNNLKDSPGDIEYLAPVHLRLRELKTAQNSIGLLEAGPHTMDFLELFEGEDIQRSKIFDNNPAKQGKFMRGFPIVKPEKITLNSDDCVLVTSGRRKTEGRSI